MPRKKILVVEDMDDIRGAIVRSLEGFYDVFAVANAEGALKRLRAAQEFSLILTDVDMPPGMDGIEFLLKAKSEGLIPPTTRLMIMSGGLDESSIRRIDAVCREFGAHFIPKPFRGLLQIIEAILVS